MSHLSASPSLLVSLVLIREPCIKFTGYGNIELFLALEWTRELETAGYKSVGETWVPAPDIDQELHTRRALMERWASADQSIRDGYVLRAQSQPRRMQCPATLLDQHHLHRFICTAPVD
ncbi:hypothetical protein Asppvi_002563 [Aspergillus pseudoviridinutans]|uniref:Uncharacterized protein n=1 Tax=Aspergillus pseudoviridinutans TaxID=1517512 RepID=A0A9P3B8B2_9EURO|nr:uncharacterized protein Asppvi_002563 [Aspergillus pseudoviridinutans]GIJ83733.1 hypothetical protein Asppvi_002563 [Aspergillus pseudoviridinutans]